MNQLRGAGRRLALAVAVGAGGAAMCSLLVPGAALAASDCGIGTPSGETAISSLSTLESDVSGLSSGQSASYYLLASLTGGSGDSLAIPAGASVTLDLNGCGLSLPTPSAGDAAIEVPVGSTLVVKDSSADAVSAPGVLTATGGTDALNADYYGEGAGAGIGGDQNGESAGTVDIESGEVVATGGTAENGSGNGAGIGGGGGPSNSSSTDVVPGGSGGTALITGGTVIATGGNGGSTYESAAGGAGIGGGGGGNYAGYPGAGGNGGSVTVDGGTVTSTGGGGSSGTGLSGVGDSGSGAGIGGGGGAGDAYGSDYAAAGAGGAGGTFTLDSGTVSAIGGLSSSSSEYDVGGAAGIGGGGAGQTLFAIYSVPAGGDGASVTLAGGSLTATGGSIGADGNTAGGYAGDAPGIGGGVGAAAVAASGTTTYNGTTLNVGGTAAGSDGASGTLKVSSAASLNGVVASAVTVESGGTLSVPASETLALEDTTSGDNVNSGTILVDGTLDGAGVLTNANVIKVGSTGSIPGDGIGSSYASGDLQITKNIFALTFDANGATASSTTPIWVYAPTLAAAGGSLPTISAPSGKTGAWCPASGTSGTCTVAVSANTSLASVVNGSATLGSTSVPSGIVVALRAELLSPATTPRPTLTKLSQSHAKWREGSKLASIARQAKQAPVGTVFRFTLNEAATVKLTFTQAVKGRRVRGRCVTQTKANRRKARCTRTVTRGTLSLRAPQGADRISFDGRISRSKKLKAGRYTVMLTAKSDGEISTTHRMTFTIVK